MTANSTLTSVCRTRAKIMGLAWTLPMDSCANAPPDTLVGFSLFSRFDISATIIITFSCSQRNLRLGRSVKMASGISAAIFVPETRKLEYNINNNVF